LSGLSATAGGVRGSGGLRAAPIREPGGRHAVAHPQVRQAARGWPALRFPHRRSRQAYGKTMQKLSLDALARELLGQAAAGEKPGDSRFSRTVVGGHEKALRQTVIALAKDAALAEHASPGEATVFVLRGRVTLAAGAESWEGREGDLIIVPDAPHSLTAQADSAVLLTVVKHPLSARHHAA
jgi:quercetin dioxygenase-like cupin family protein